MVLLGFFSRQWAWLIHYPAGFVVALAYAGLVIIGIVQAATRAHVNWGHTGPGAYAER